MTQAVPPREEETLQGPRFGAAMTAKLALRQGALLLALATSFFGMLFFFDLYGVINFDSLWNNLPNFEWGWLSLPMIIVLVYGYFILTGSMFSLGPSERSFNVFFGIMVVLVMAVNYDHTVIDWFLQSVRVNGASVRIDRDDYDPVSAFKVLFAGLFFLIMIVMHYNVLADDFARRMVRRGVPTQEVFAIRGGMFKAVIPTVGTAIAVAFGLALVGELSWFMFQTGGLFAPKVQLLILAALVVPMAFLVRSIVRDLAARRRTPPAGPNR